MKTGDPNLAEPAIELAKRYLQEDPNGSFVAEAHLIIAKAHVTKRDVSNALCAFRSAVDAEVNTRGLRCYAYLEFAWFATMNNLTEVFEEALKAMESMQAQDLIFPINQFKYFGALAFISDFQRNRDHARKMANNALRADLQPAGPFPQHKDVGKVRGIDEDVQRRIWQLAV